MKMVEFTRDMRPHVAGETRIVPDNVAAALVAAGDAKERDSIFDKAAAPESKGRGKPYFTRKR